MGFLAPLLGGLGATAIGDIFGNSQNKANQQNADNQAAAARSYDTQALQTALGNLQNYESNNPSPGSQYGNVKGPQSLYGAMSAINSPTTNVAGGPSAGSVQQMLAAIMGGQGGGATGSATPGNAQPGMAIGARPQNPGQPQAGQPNNQLQRLAAMVQALSGRAGSPAQAGGQSMQLPTGMGGPAGGSVSLPAGMGGPATAPTVGGMRTGPVQGPSTTGAPRANI